MVAKTGLDIFADSLVMFGLLRKPSSRGKLCLCRHDDTVGAHHHVNDERSHLRHAANEDALPGKVVGKSCGLASLHDSAILENCWLRVAAHQEAIKGNAHSPSPPSHYIKGSLLYCRGAFVHQTEKSELYRRYS